MNKDHVYNYIISYNKPISYSLLYDHFIKPASYMSDYRLESEKQYTKILNDSLLELAADELIITFEETDKSLYFKLSIKGLREFKLNKILSNE